MVSPEKPLKTADPLHGQLNTVHYTLDVLEYLSEQNRPVRLTEICKKLGLSKSKIYRVLATLVQRGYVRKDSRTRDYSLDISTWRLARSVSDLNKLTELVQPDLDALVGKVGETAFLSILHKKAVYYLYTKMGANPTISYLEVGSTVPIHATASGKILLSYESPEYFEDLLEDNLQKCSDRTLVDPEDLSREMELVRKQGYSIEKDEWGVGFSAIATAIPTFSKGQVAAIGLFLPTSRMVGKRQEELIDALMNSKKVILNKLQKGGSWG